MSPIVSLKDVVDEMEMASDEITAYLNIKTGEVVSISDEDRSLAESEEEDAKLQDWQVEQVALAREILAGHDYLALPSRFDIHEYKIMERYCETVEEERLRNELLRAIGGKGAFRRFKDTLLDHGIEKSWYAFKRAAFEEIAVEWLQDHGITYSTDPPSDK